MADENADLTDLEREIDETVIEDAPTDEDFKAGAADDADDALDLPAAQPARREAPEIADDLEVARNQAARAAQEWEAYYAAKDQELAEARKAAADANESGELTSAELVAAQERLQGAVLDHREAAKGVQKARDDLAQASRPRTQAAQSWIDANPRFKTDVAFRDRAAQIAAELQADYRTDSPLMYQELDRRLRAKTVMGNKGAARAGGAPTSRQPERGRDVATATATPFDVKWMRKVGLDPSNKRHLGEWKKHYNDLAAEG
jgi:hypothetical protein